MLAVPGIDIDRVGSCVASRARPGPLIFGGPVLHRLPGVLGRRSLQPELVVDRLSVRIGGHSRPFYSRACRLRAGPVGHEGDECGGLVGPQHCKQGPGVVIPSGGGGMQAVSDLYLDLAGSSVYRRCPPHPVRICGPVPHQHPGIAGGRTLQPVAVEYCVALRVHGCRTPPDGSSNGLGAAHAAGQARHRRRLVEVDYGVACHFVVVRSRRPGMLSIPDCHQDLAVAHIPSVSPPCPAVVLAPAGLVNPKSAGRWPAQEEPVLKRVAIRIGCQSRPPDPASRILRCRPVCEQDVDPRLGICGAQCK